MAMPWRIRVEIYDRFLLGEQRDALAAAYGVPPYGPAPSIEAAVREEINMSQAIKRDRLAVARR